jgi:hypothetical protein
VPCNEPTGVGFPTDARNSKTAFYEKSGDEKSFAIETKCKYNKVKEV